jgi:hypothetical protein
MSSLPNVCRVTLAASTIYFGLEAVCSAFVSGTYGVRVTSTVVESPLKFKGEEAAIHNGIPCRILEIKTV